jgi:hypothetical protein
LTCSFCARFRPGRYALKSKYELKKAGESLESDTLKLQLDDAEPMTLVVRDSRGRAAAKAHVIPFNRKTVGGEEHGGLLPGGQTD